jgi:hypothetical protein
MVATMRWLGLALLGILIAAAVSVAASRLASQQIGLASQPISAGDALAPAPEGKPTRQTPRQHAGKRPPATTAPTAAEPPAEPLEPEPSAPVPAETPSGGGESDHQGGGDD